MVEPTNYVLKLYVKMDFNILQYKLQYKQNICSPKNIYSFFRRRFPIKDTPQNLVDLRLHYVYGMSLALMTFIVDQLKHILLELFYPWIGPELAFHIWTFVFLLENIGVWKVSSVYFLKYFYLSGLRLSFNMIFLSTATRDHSFLSSLPMQYK